MPAHMTLVIALLRIILPTPVAHDLRWSLTSRSQGLHELSSSTSKPATETYWCLSDKVQENSLSMSAFASIEAHYGHFGWQLFFDKVSRPFRQSNGSDFFMIQNPKPTMRQAETWLQHSIWKLNVNKHQAQTPNANNKRSACMFEPALGLAYLYHTASNQNQCVCCSLPSVTLSPQCTSLWDWPMRPLENSWTPAKNRTSSK